MYIFIAVLLLFIVLGIGIGYFISGPNYQGPKTDHFNGNTFENLGGIKSKGGLDVLKWLASRKREPWEKRDETTYEVPIERVNDSTIRVTFVNHSTFLIQVNGLNILTDPIWSERTSPVQWAGPARFRKPGIRFEDLPPIDAVIISHNHYDHLDDNTMKRLAKAHDPIVFTPLGVAAYIENLIDAEVAELDWWEEMKLSDKLTLTCVPAQHFSGRGIFDRDKTLWAGWVIKRAEGNVYFAGDSGYGAFFKEIGERCAPIRLGIIPIGAYKPEWFMSPIHISPQEAVQVHQDCQAQQSIAMHYGTFPLADDGMKEPINALNKVLEKANLDASDFMVIEEGKAYSFGVQE